MHPSARLRLKYTRYNLLVRRRDNLVCVLFLRQELIKDSLATAMPVTCFIQAAAGENEALNAVVIRREQWLGWKRNSPLSRA